MQISSRLAAWMIDQGFVTGHGDNIDDLLKELTWQVEELKAENGQLKEIIQSLDDHGRAAGFMEHLKALHAELAQARKERDKALDSRAEWMQKVTLDRQEIAQLKGELKKARGG